jgi:hypothetical protein
MEPSSNGSSPGTVAATTDVMANAIAHAAAGPQPIGDIADKAFDKAVAEEPKPSEPAKPKEEPKKETPVTEPPSAVVAAPEEDEGYFADEGLDDEPPAPAPAPSPSANPLPQSFTPQEQYVAQHIGQPITVDIIVNDQPQRVQAYALENLPQGFKFASDYAAAQAAKGFAKLELKAENLVADFERNQQTEQAKKFSSQEDRDIQRDIAYLQRQKKAGKDGLPLFPKGISPDDPEFEGHPAVKEMQDVLEYYNKENGARWQQSQARGSQYRPLTYRDAFKLYRSEHPVTTPSQAKEDKERKQITGRLAKANAGTGEAPKGSRPKLPWNASVDQIARAYGL